MQNIPHATFPQKSPPSSKIFRTISSHTQKRTHRTHIGQYEFSLHWGTDRIGERYSSPGFYSWRSEEPIPKRTYWPSKYSIALHPPLDATNKEKHVAYRCEYQSWIDEQCPHAWMNPVCLVTPPLSVLMYYISGKKTADSKNCLCHGNTATANETNS